MPGISKTDSMMIEPAKRSPIIGPRPVAIGMSALRKAWPQIARRRVAPLAITVRM